MKKFCIKLLHPKIKTKRGGMPLRAESSPPPGSVLLRRMQSSRPGKPAATQLRSTLLRLLLPALHPPPHCCFYSRRSVPTPRDIE